MEDYSQPLEIEDLVTGEVYFLLHFVDDRLLVPIIRPVVFLGQVAKEPPVLRFQDAGSYLDGVREQHPSFEEEADVFSYQGRPAVFSFEGLLEELERVASRRRRHHASRGEGDSK